jgi:hypothetical protein
VKEDCDKTKIELDLYTKEFNIMEDEAEENIEEVEEDDEHESGEAKKGKDAFMTPA